MFFSNSFFSQISLKDTITAHTKDSLVLTNKDSLKIIKKDTIYTIDKEIESELKALARDSMFHDYKKEQLHLYGEAKLFYQDIQMEADYIVVDFVKSEVYATYTLDKDSNRVGIPKFTEDGQEMNASKIRYNFDTQKGFIEEVKLKQDENYLYMDVAKRHPNEHIHFKRGKFTSCSLEEPHFHLFLTKAIMIPEKRIVSGPMNFWVQGVPTPLGLPFMFIPQKKEKARKNGFLMPQYSLQSSYGMGFQNLGYYIPINDSLQTTFFADLYSRGSWGLSNDTDYKIKYRFEGTVQLAYQQFNSGFPLKTKSNKLSITWQHKQDQKANPYWNFSSNVNFQSDNSPKTSLDPLNKSYFENSLNSDVNINRSFPGKPYSSGLKLSVRQNSKSNNFAVTSPSFNFNVTRFSPFSIFKKEKVGAKKWYEQVVMTYNLESQNRSSFHDSLFNQKRYDLIGKTFLNGIQQGSTLQSTIGVFKNIIKINPSITYTNRINFQQIRKKYDAVLNTTKIDTLKQAGMSHLISFNVQLTTILYSYYKFIGKNKTLLRHILTPNIGFRYSPNLMKNLKDTVGVNKAEVIYSPFERSLYAQGLTETSGQITFGINNTFELKNKSSKDSITGFKKTRIVDALSFSGSYDLLKDSMKLSQIASSLRINPVERISIVANAQFSPYDWDDSTNYAKKEYAIDTRGTLARLMNFNVSTSYNITSKKSKSKIAENQKNMQDNWTADLNYYALHPYEIIDFEIPWKMTFSHIFDINRTLGTKIDNKNFSQTHTLTFNADYSITKRWKVISDMYYDVKIKKVTNTRLTITRDMHCWNLALYWTPIGANKSFLLRIVANSSLFQSAKLEFKKPPVF
jgi:lipopolysaccharide assembly outer membrane protein LptD (OstA)